MFVVFYNQNNMSFIHKVSLSFGFIINKVEKCIVFSYQKKVKHSSFIIITWFYFVLG